MLSPVLSSPPLTELSPRTTPYLKSPHVPRVPRRLQTILVTLEEELEEEPAEVNKRTRWSVEQERSMETLGAGAWPAGHKR